MDPLAERVAVITGGASGIGKALATAFAARGARLALADVDEAALAETAEELRGQGAELLPVATDVTQRKSVEELADRVFAHFGAAHVICNNAGVSTFGELVKASHEDWEFTMAVNFWGVVHGIESFVPRLIEQGQGGHVVNTASMAGLVGMQWLGVYCASKFAVVGLSEALRRELAPHEIGVSVLCPMIVDTNITANSARLHPQASANSAPPLPSGAAMQGGIKPASEVAARVVRALERGDFYVLTHDEQRPILQRRADYIDASFAADRWPL